MSGQLRAVTLVNVAAAGTYPSTAGYPLDYRQELSSQGRTVHVAAVNAADTVQVQTSIDGTNWANQGTALAAPAVVSISGPWAFLRVVKTGATGVATVLGLI